MKTRFKNRVIAPVIAVMVLSVFSPEKSSAGNIFVGLKGWYTSWDSGILDQLESDIGRSFTQNNLQLRASKNPGNGYFIGPLLGYQTNDGKWSIGLAGMFISSFNQEWKGNAGPMQLTGDVGLKRQDYDLAVSYIFLKYFKVYGGYKFQNMDLNFRLSFDTPMGTQTDVFKVDAQSHIPTIGIGAVLPLFRNFVISGQLGGLYAITSMKITNTSGRTEDIWPHPATGFVTEINFSYQPWERKIIQVGYRYQVFTIRARGAGEDTKTTSYDITHGGTIALAMALQY